MFNRIVVYTLILCLAFPHQLAVVFADTGSDDMEAKIETANNLQDKLSRLISADGIEFDLRDAPADPPPQDPPPQDPPPQDPPPQDPPPQDPPPQDPPPQDPPPQDPPPQDPPPSNQPDNNQVKIVYACLMENLQKSVAKLYEYARPAIVEYNGSQLSTRERPALKFSVVVDGDGLSSVRFRPFGRCYQNAASLPAGDYRNLIFDLKYILEDGAVAGILSELKEIEEVRKEGGVTDQYVMRNASRSIQFKPKKAPDSRESGVKHVLRELANRSSLEPVGPGLNGIVDPSFNNLVKYSLKNAGYWIVALQILLNASFDTREEMEAEAVRDQTAREIDSAENARDEAEDAEKAEKRKEFWGNVAKIGLAVGGGILAWKLIDSLNSDDEDDDDDEDRFDGPMMPPPPPPWMMQPPYGPPGYPGGYPPGGYPPPYPPQPAYPPTPQMPPQVPPPPVQQGPDYGRILVDLKAKLEAIIRLQRDLITKYIQRTNSNMTESDKDTFRRTVAQIDGLVREANPLIQMMENTPVPANPQDMGTIFDARRKVYQYITEVKDNDRQIKEFMAQLNLMGSGVAGPMAAQSSPGVVAPAGPTPWTNPKAIALVDEYLAKNKLNRWGYPDTPGVIQNTPPSAMGKNRYQWLMDNPDIRSYVNRGMQ